MAIRSCRLNPTARFSSWVSASRNLTIRRINDKRERCSGARLRNGTNAQHVIRLPFTVQQNGRRVFQYRKSGPLEIFIICYAPRSDRVTSVFGQSLLWGGVMSSSFRSFELFLFLAVVPLTSVSGLDADTTVQEALQAEVDGERGRRNTLLNEDLSHAPEQGGSPVMYVSATIGCPSKKPNNTQRKRDRLPFTASSGTRLRVIWWARYRWPGGAGKIALKTGSVCIGSAC